MSLEEGGLHASPILSKAFSLSGLSLVLVLEIWARMSWCTWILYLEVTGLIFHL